MEKRLQEIVNECVLRGIRVMVTSGPDKQLAYEVDGFSKSGIAIIYAKGQKILSHTRYDTIDEIDDFHDLALVALEWFLNYRNRTPFEEPDSKWAEYWVEKGIMEKKTTISYVMK